MLQRLHVKNFRCLKDVGIDFDPDVASVLIGPNAGGKSTILEVLDFLSLCADEGLQKAVAAHGGTESIKTKGSNKVIEIETDWSLPGPADTAPCPDVYEWRFGLRPTRVGGVLVQWETLARVRGADRRTIVSTDEAGNRFVHPPPGDAGDPVAVADALALMFEAAPAVKRFELVLGFKKVVKTIAIRGSLAVEPGWMRVDNAFSPRDSATIGQRDVIGHRGVGLTNVLYGLREQNADLWAELERAFITEFPFVKRIIFPADPAGGRIAFAIDEARWPQPIYASEMSDGMVSFLCLLSMLIHPDHHSVRGFDEPENHLHPSAIRAFMDFAQEPRGGRQVVMVTHSDSLLDCLDDPARSVRIVEPSDQGTVVRKLDPGSLDAWRKTYTLSDMRRARLLDQPNERYGKPR